jgi:hypothetical protein
MVLFNEEMLRAEAPAVFATSPEEGRVSDRYSFLPTTEILEILQEEGWTAWKARQVGSRKWSRDHAKHIVRLRHRDLDVKNFAVGDSFPEMLVVNSHNGLGGYKLQAGIFRLVCSNGAVVSESDFGTIHIRHIGFDPQQVKDASRRLVSNASVLKDKVDRWQKTELSERSRMDFFTDAARLRFTDPDNAIIQEVSTARRQQDVGNDLWRTFNVAQENLIRGGYRNQQTRRMVRSISNIQLDIDLNQQLWELASQYAGSTN